MQTCMEELPLEIWLTIFQYLEVHDLFRAFQNLNSYFDRIIASTHLSFYLRLKKSDGNHQQCPVNPYWSDSVLDRVTCLRLVVQYQPTYFLEFLRWHSKKLIRLQSLSAKIEPRDLSLIPFVCQSLKELHRLQCLFLTSEPHQIVFETIFSLSTLRICQFILKEPAVSFGNHLLDIRSPIKQLYLVFLSRINYSLVNTLLFHTAELKRLELSGSSFSFEPIPLFTEQLFILPKLHILKLKLEGGFFTSDCFRCLHTIMPVLKEFYFHYKKHVLMETFLDRFINDWWPIIDPIQHIDIYIKGYLIIDDNDATTQTNLQKNRQILLDKTNRSNGFFKSEWNEQKILRLTLIEITIVK